MGIALLAIWVSQVWRVSALYNHDKKFLCKMILPFVGFFGVLLWCLQSNIGIPNEYIVGCSYIKTKLLTNYLKFLWWIFLSWEVIIIALTVRKTLEITKASRGLFGRRLIGTVMLQDGILYFLAIAGLHLANIVTFFVESPVLVEDAFLWPGACLCVILTSRLMINLKENLHKTVGYSSFERGAHDSSIPMTDIVFRRMPRLDDEQTIY